MLEWCKRTNSHCVPLFCPISVPVPFRKLSKQGMPRIFGQCNRSQGLNFSPCSGVFLSVIYLMEISSLASLLHRVIAVTTPFQVTRANVTTYNRKGREVTEFEWGFGLLSASGCTAIGLSHHYCCNSDQHRLPQVRLERGNLQPSISCLEEGCHDMVTRQGQTSQLLSLPLTKHICWYKAFWNLSLVLQRKQVLKATLKD